MASELESDLQDTVDWGKKLISMLEKLNKLHLTGLNTLVLLVSKWIGLFLRKNHLLRCWGWLSLLNWIGVLTLSLLLKLPPRKSEPLFVLWSFFLLRLALYLYKSTIQPCMEYCFHVWAVDSSYYLKLLDKLQKLICRTVGPSLAASLEPLGHRRNVASSGLFYWYYFGRCSSELAKLFPLIVEGGLHVILIDCVIFQSPFLNVTRMSRSTVPFLAQLESGILCLYYDFIRPTILVALSLELTGIF